MSDRDKFEKLRSDILKALASDGALAEASLNWLINANAKGYSYTFDWLGRPIIQYPQDIVAMQELVFRIKPDLIIETGIARGGSIIYYASLLELNSVCGGPIDAKVLGIDIDIRPHNREAIEAHPLMKRVDMIEGSSIDPYIIQKVKKIAEPASSVLVVLDSNHTHDHVLAELEAYGPLVSADSYCVVFDTVIEMLPDGMFPDRPWGAGNNAMTAVEAYLMQHPEFSIDEEIDAKLLISVAPRGYLRRAS